MPFVQLNKSEQMKIPSGDFYTAAIIGIYVLQSKNR